MICRFHLFDSNCPLLRHRSFARSAVLIERLSQRFGDDRRMTALEIASLEQFHKLPVLQKPDRRNREFRIDRGRRRK